MGIVFAKLSRPKKRTQTLLFSRHAVISHRDGIPCFMFRVGDMRKSHIIEAHVRAQLIRHKVTKEGESLPFFQTELKVITFATTYLKLCSPVILTTARHIWCQCLFWAWFLCTVFNPFTLQLKQLFQVGGDGEEDKIFFIWPTTIVHKIDSTSPLYTMSATDLLRERFEIVVILGKFYRWRFQPI